MINILKPLWSYSADEGFPRSVEEFVERRGGAALLLARMRQLNLVRQADSWTTKGPPEPISGEQLHLLFGTSELRALAAKLSLSPRDLVRRLSQTLPQIVHKLAAHR